MNGKTSRPAVGPRGRLKTSELPAHVARLSGLGLFPQTRRARLIELLIDSQGFTVAGFARALGVTRRVVYAFLDPRNPHLPSPRVADRIDALRELYRSADQPAVRRRPRGMKS